MLMTLFYVRGLSNKANKFVMNPSWGMNVVLQKLNQYLAVARASK